MNLVTNALYTLARNICNRAGLPWTDPRTGVRYTKPMSGVPLIKLELGFDDSMELVDAKPPRTCFGKIEGCECRLIYLRLVLRYGRDADTVGRSGL